MQTVTSRPKNEKGWLLTGCIAFGTVLVLTLLLIAYLSWIFMPPGTPVDWFGMCALPGMLLLMLVVMTPLMYARWRARASIEERRRYVFLGARMVFVLGAAAGCLAAFGNLLVAGTCTVAGGLVCVAGVALMVVQAVLLYWQMNTLETQVTAALPRG